MNDNNETDLCVDPSMDLCTCGTCGRTAKIPAPFTAQGYIENSYYFYVKKIDRIVLIKSNQFKQRYLLKLARIDYWREHFGTSDRRKQSCVDWNEVEISLMTKCYEKGEFQGAIVRTIAVRKYTDDVCFAKNIPEA